MILSDVKFVAQCFVDLVWVFSYQGTYFPAMFPFLHLGDNVLIVISLLAVNFPFALLWVLLNDAYKGLIHVGTSAAGIKLNIIHI